MLNSSAVVFSDHRCCCSDNLSNDELTEDERSRCSFIEYDWSQPLPDLLVHGLSKETNSLKVWDTVLCSDVVYDNKALEPLLNCLSQLSFRRLIISYKRRHDEREKLFFQKLSELCVIKAVKQQTIPLVNLKPSSLAGLYILIAVKRTA